jgi:hypothetical protein
MVGDLARKNPGVSHASSQVYDGCINNNRRNHLQKCFISNAMYNREDNIMNVFTRNPGQRRSVFYS